jgi:hypothetical protein
VTSDPHPCWPNGFHIRIGDVGLIHVNGETNYHSAYGPVWWVGRVDGINRDVVQFGCGEQIASELVAHLPGFPNHVDTFDLWWATAQAAVDGLRSRGVVPPHALLIETLKEPA